VSRAEIIRGGADHLPAIMPVMASAFGTRYGEAWTESQCLGVVSLPGSHLMIAQHDSAVGFALSRIVLDECELMLLAVSPELQRTGIGRDLLDAIIADARAVKAASVFLEVRSGNPAVMLYSSMGFVEVGRRRGYYRGPFGETFDALTYRLALS
jgi:[ribosomal protein S18]-alanine N-acetyltransferase